MNDSVAGYIEIKGAAEHNLKNLDLRIKRGTITVVTGVSGSGKSSLAFDTILAESQRRFFYTLSHYTRQFLEVSARPNVKRVSGLSPAIALAQNETLPTRRSTVGSLTDLAELWGVMFARFGNTHCPTHDLPTKRWTADEIHQIVCSDYADRLVALVRPIAENRKGMFRTQMEQLAKKGFSKIWIDGELVDLNPIPTLNKESKHTLRLLVDVIRVSSKNHARIRRSIELALADSDGIVELYGANPDGSITERALTRFSLRGGCPTCGYSWPRLDTRYFSANSLGKCEHCDGYGTLSKGDDPEIDSSDWDNHCEECQGTGLGQQLKAIRFMGMHAIDIHSMNLRRLLDFTEKATAAFEHNPAAHRVLGEISAHISRLCEVGLEYLQTGRRIRSLSGGELQRLKLAGVLGEHLRGVLYVLDEPSQGLHPSELQKIIGVLMRLRDQGNTVIVVDHDEQIMMAADQVIDLGPVGGEGGGHLMAQFAPTLARDFVDVSSTAMVLQKHHDLALRDDHPTSKDHWIVIYAPRINNLAMDEVKLRVGAWNVVTGVSGAGKTSLVVKTLWRNAHQRIGVKKPLPWVYCKRIDGFEHFSRVVLVDRKPVAKSSVSMPGTYLDVLPLIRDLFAALPESQVAGFSAREYSLHHEGGRCEACKGRGEINMVMRFLPDARVVCDVCGGRRFRAHILTIEYNGTNISQVLDMSLQQVRDLFERVPAITRKLDPAIQLGLGYLKFGQPTSSLSGGEAQRLKIAPFMAPRLAKGTLFVVIEPTTGLHGTDCDKLAEVLQSLIAVGATVVMVEHNLSMIARADWVVDIGPGSASDGGRVVFCGTPADLARDAGSAIAPFLA